MQFSNFLGSLDPTPSGLLNWRDDPQAPPLQRKDLEPCALGVVGNLAYTAQEEGTASGTRTGAPLSDLRPSLTDKCVDATSIVIAEPSQERARSEVLLEIRANSARIGDLLGSLTATAYEPDPLRQRLNHTRIAEALTALNVPPAGDLYSLKGAKYCLDTYLNELTEPDFIALRFGALSSARFCKDILDLIPTSLDEASRIQMFRALVNIAEAVDQRVNQFAMRGPMFQLADLLTAEPVDGQNLHKQLLMLPICASTIREHIEILSMDEFKALLGAFQPDGLNAARRALSQFADDRAQPSLAMLNLVSTELDVQFLRRAPSGLMHYSVGLEMALGAGNRLAASNALYRLSLAVKDTRRVFGMLPDYMNKTLLRQVEQSMDLFRDDQTNPVGPLNGQSLRKLDDGIRANLGGAAKGLRSFGLELKPEEH